LKLCSICRFCNIWVCIDLWSEVAGGGRHRKSGEKFLLKSCKILDGCIEVCYNLPLYRARPGYSPAHGRTASAAARARPCLTISAL